MTHNLKTKSMVIIGIIIVLSPIISNGLIFDAEISEELKFDDKNLNPSIISGPIFINGLSPSSNWSVAIDTGICTGNGTYSEPYIIKDLVIDGGGSGSCIWIVYSEVYFRIENCTVFNAGDEIPYINYYDAGIRLKSVSNGTIINNNCSSNPIIGIYLENCNNNTISGNTLNYNTMGYGIFLVKSHNNTLLGNTGNYNGDIGIYLAGCDNNTISGNIATKNDHYGIYLSGNNNIATGNLMNECGLRVSGSLESLSSNNIDTTNLVNGKPLYYYVDRASLEPSNFTNAGQVIMAYCNDSLLTNLNVSYSSIGITLLSSNNNYILGNTANNNIFNGISVDGDNNTISGNTVNNNDFDGLSIGGNYNNISGNTANYNRDDGISIGYPITGGYRVGGKHNIIIGNTASYNGDCGIYLNGEWPSSSGYCTISENTANHNMYGIKLWRLNYNTISGNDLSGNYICIEEDDCEGNVFSDNGSCTYGDGNGGQAIPGYNLFFLLGVLSVVAIILSKKKKKM